MPQVHDPLSAADALLWRIETDPVLRSPILVVGLVDRPPSWERVRASAARAVDAVPRLRRRVVTTGPFARPSWVEDDGFCLDHHLRRVRVATGGDLRAVLDLAEPDAAAAFDPARPPWAFTVVDGLDDGRAAFVLRFHHAISDGVGAVGLADHLFDRTRRPATAEPPAPAAGAEPDGRSPAAAVVDAARAAARLAADPIGTAARTVRFVRSLGRLLEAAPEPLSPLLRDRGLDRHLDVLEVPLADLRRAARAAGGTVNDAFLAAVGGALRRYHEEHGARVDALRLTVPISLREGGDEEGGNHFTPARFVLPVDDPDPVRRIRIANAIVRRWRDEPALRASMALAELLDLLPTPVLVRLFAGMLRGVDVDAVDVPGVRHAIYVGGARVERLWAFAPPTGAALSVTLVSHGPTACIGVAADTAAVTDPERLRSCLEGALDEVLAAGAAKAVIPA